MKDEVKYFAYGSNLNLQQMEERGVVVKSAQRADLPGWKLAFTVYSEGWKGGVADILPHPEERIEGIVYELKKKDMKELDRYEGRKLRNKMEVGMYRRQHLPVKIGDEWKTVLTYLVNMAVEYKKEMELKPSRGYMKTILSGAEEHGLSTDYIQRLKSIDHR